VHAEQEHKDNNERGDLDGVHDQAGPAKKAYLQHRSPDLFLLLPAESGSTIIVVNRLRR
jgi:hypothetical protein